MENEMDENEIAEIQKVPARWKDKPKRKYARRAKPKAPPAPPPEDYSEFTGLSPKSCCDACLRNREEIEKAQHRLNEMERTYPRGPSRRRVSDTVMESDGEWLARICDPEKPTSCPPAMAEKIRKDWGEIVIGLKGSCHLTREGTGICGHPYLNAAQPSDQVNPVIVERRKRAARMLSRIMDARRD